MSRFITFLCICIIAFAAISSVQGDKTKYCGTTFGTKMCELCGAKWCESERFHKMDECTITPASCCTDGCTDAEMLACC